MICAKSYQSIPDDPRDNILSSEDYFDMFYSELCKRNGVKDFSDEEYEIIRRWWYEFENGSGNDTDSGCDKSVEDMESELKDFDEGREKHTCETYERKRCDVFCKHCRTGCNDDYTMTDYWHSYTQVEQRLWKRIAELKAQIKEMKCCGNCQTVRDAEGNCYLLKDGKCKNKDKWELRR